MEDFLNVLVLAIPMIESGTVCDRGWAHTPPTKVWLSSGFRVTLIKAGIDKAGSVNQLGRELGYRSRVHPGWSIRQILVGKQPFPFDRLVMLADYLECSLEEIMRHQTVHAAVTLESTRRALSANGMPHFLP